MSVPLDLSEIEAALRAGDMDRAAGLAQVAVEAGSLEPVLLRLSADRSARQGDYDAAMAWLDRGLAVTPRDAGLLCARGGLLRDLDRHAEAIPTFQAALATAPNLAEAHLGLGESLGAFGLVADARLCFENALKSKGAYPDAEAAMATLLARTGQPAAARAHAERALALSPGHPAATYALAAIEVAEKRFAAAALRLNALTADPRTAPVLRASCLCLTGDALHGQDRHRRAFDAWRRGKALFEAIYAPAWSAPALAAWAFLGRLCDYFAEAPAAVWSTAPEQAREPGEPLGHAFLIGFNRSGTTLLEQVLASHPQVVTLEEQPLLLEAERAFMHDRAGLDALAAIDAPSAARLRKAYWAAVRGCGVEPEGKVFIDKMPMNVSNLPLMAKLFPRAKVLFARRDPRDVVLSCFRHTFAPNPSNFLMLTPGGAAALYDRVMGLAELYRERLAIPLHEVRYERFVSDFEAECRAVCAFLGLDWVAGMADFADRARDRAITTPSAGQVRQGLYRGGEGQWLAYRDELAPVLPVLEPWVERFGYPPS